MHGTSRKNIPINKTISHSKPFLTINDRNAVNAVLKSGMIAQGKQVKIFETGIANSIDAVGGLATGSGTAALSLSLEVLGIGTGDEVILPTYVCHNVADAVIQCGAVPVFCDIGEDWLMSPETVMPLITAKTRAIILVHIYGIVLDVQRFQKFGISLIEDCCQAFGATLKGKSLGKYSDIAFFSFHATKCLATGEGGMMTSHNPEIIEKARLLQQSCTVPSPMTDMQAALGSSQLKRYSEMLKRRHQLAERYLKELPHSYTTRISACSDRSIFFRFPLNLVGGNPISNVISAFEAEGIAVRRGVDELLHLRYKQQDTSYPVANRLYAETLSIPIYPALTDREQDRIIEACHKILG